MPTGYTADLEKKNYNLKSWLKENVVRGMGVCMILRDSGSMTEKDIKKALQVEEVSYHAKKLAESQIEVNKFSKMTTEEFKKQYENEYSEALKAFEKSEKEHREKSAAHLKSLDESRKLLGIARASNRSDLIVNTLKFAVEQLESAYTFDYGSGPYKAEILKQSFDEWKDKKFKSLAWNVSYHAEQQAKETVGTSDRYRQYLEFVEFVDSN